nr:aminotransferase class I/II-fold pyridoxal phosphate-dependent enzyme [Pseudomonadota bacterium]
MISNRSKSIDSSGIRKVFDLAAKLKDPINLSIGQPDFDAFEEIKTSTINAINNKKNGYTLTQGIPELRKKIQNLYGYQDTEDYNCLITSGVSGGIMLAYLAMLDPGDEILIPDPYFVMYRDLATLINAKPVCYNTYPDFTIREEELEKSVNPKTKAIIISSPGNPTGCAMTASEIEVLVSFAKKHQIWIIFDEI